MEHGMCEPATSEAVEPLCDHIKASTRSRYVICLVEDPAEDAPRNTTELGSGHKTVPVNDAAPCGDFWGRENESRYGTDHQAQEDILGFLVFHDEAATLVPILRHDVR